MIITHVKTVSPCAHTVSLSFVLTTFIPELIKTGYIYSHRQHFLHAPATLPAAVSAHNNMTMNQIHPAFTFTRTMSHVTLVSQSKKTENHSTKKQVQFISYSTSFSSQSHTQTHFTYLFLPTVNSARDYTLHIE